METLIFNLRKFLYQKSLIVIFLFLVSNVYGQAPTTPSSNFSVSNNDGNQFYLNYTKGDGARRIIIASTNPVAAVPQDGADYVANSTYGLGNELKPGEFVVYNGSSYYTNTGTWIYGLNHSTTYYFRIYEFNGTDYNTEYLTSDFLDGSGTTLTGPIVQASDLTFSNITGTSMTVNFSAGDGSGRILVGRAGSAVEAEPQDLTSYSSYSYAFGYPTSSSYSIGTNDQKVLYQGSGSSVTIYNLDPNVTYHFSVFEYNGNYGKIYLRPGTIANQITSSYPTIAASAGVFSNMDGDRLYQYFTRGNGEKRIVIAKKGSAVTSIPTDGIDYTANSTFGLGQELNAGEFVVYNGTAGGHWTYGLEPDTEYHFAIFEYNGTGENTFYLKDSYLASNQSTISAPTFQAGDLTFSNITGTSMTVNFSAGDGSGRILVGRAGSAVEAEPQDLTSYSSYSYAFGYPTSSSYSIGTNDQKVLYQGSGSSVTIYNLDPKVTYHFSVFEYNGNYGKIYLRPGTIANQITSSYPTIAASAGVFSNMDGDRLYQYFTRGNGEKRIVIAKKGSAVTSIPTDGIDYTANSTFGLGQELNAGEFVVYNGTAGGHWTYGLEPDTEYHFAIFEYNGSGENTFYLIDSYLASNQSTISAPTFQAGDLTFSNITGTSMTVNFSAGDGSGRILVGRAVSAVEAEPQDLTSYSSYSYAFGYPTSSSYSIGTNDQKVLYQGSGSSVTIYNLDPNVTYHFSVFEYNGNYGKIYLRPGTIANQITSSYPTIAASAGVFSNMDGDRLYQYFTRGNGEKRIVIAKKGSAVTSIPTDGIDYTANSTYGLGQELNAGEFVVYNGTAGGHWTYGLEPDTEYHFAVFEYNGSGENTFYLKDSYLASNQSTISAPTVQSSNAFLSSRSTTSLNISWTKGNGSNRLLIARKDGPVNLEPEDLKNYSTYNQYGYYQVGTSGNYALYSGSGNNVNITNLEAGTNYHFALFEYNGSNGKLYLRPGYAFALETFGERPTVQVSNAQFSNINFSSFDVNMTAGNGSRRLVLAREGGPVSTGPADFTTYSASSTFSQGTEIGTGNFVVFNDFGESFSLDGLNSGKNYHLSFYEYSVSADGELYMAPSYTASQTTLGAPTQIATNFAVSASCTTEPALTWTAGNGSGRIVVVSPEELNAFPVNYTNYSSNVTYGSGESIGNGFVLYNGAENSVSISGLEPYQNYHVNIFEYNSSADGPFYGTTSLTEIIGDQEPPILSCLTTDIEVALSQIGEATITVDQVDIGSTDNCGIEKREIDISSFSCADIGKTIPVTLSVTDYYGNIETCSVNVIVMDNISPVITLNDPIIANACSGDIEIVEPSVVDNCNGNTVKAFNGTTPIAIESYSLPQGTTVITWMVTDQAGNETTAEQTFNNISVQSATLTSVSSYALNQFVSPESGSSDSQFEFKVLYTNADGIFPDTGFPKVELDANRDGDAIDPLDRIIIMQEADAADLDVTDGKIYSVNVTNLDELQWHSRIVTDSEDGCSIKTLFTAAPFVSDNLLDLSIFASDISFSKDNPAIDEPIKIYARINNPSDFPAENFVVSVYAEDQQLFFQTVPLIEPNSNLTLEWEYNFAIADFYPIKVVVDETDVLFEQNELDNFAIRPVIVGDYVLPGGININASLATSQLYPGQSIRITGNALYFGIDEGVDPDVAGATLTATIEGERSGQTYSRSDGTFDLYIRVPDTPGIYTVEGTITDYTLSADYGPLTFEVLETPPSPDLISSISIPDATFLAGDEVSGTATVTNRGNLLAENFLFKYYNCEEIIGEQLITALEPGESLSFSFTATVNSVTNCFNPNNCNFVSEADPDKRISESIEFNNLSSRAVTVLPDAPDLTPIKCSVPSNFNMLQEANFNIRLDNIGGAAVASDFNVRVYMDEELIHTESYLNLDRCGTATFSFTYNFIDTNDHVLRVKIDEDDVITEFNELNNVYTKTITHLPPPPLIPNLNIDIYGLQVIPSLPLEGENFELLANFKNTGNGVAIAPFNVEYLVTENGQERLQSVSIDADLAPGESTTSSIQTSLSRYGNHAVEVFIDHEFSIEESNENDNKAGIPLCLDFNPVPSGSVWSGGFFKETQQQLTARIKNKGLFTATNPEIKFYLDGELIASTTISKLGPTYYSQGTLVSIPYTFSESGSHILKVTVDEIDVFTECDELNNSFEKTIIIQEPRADLRVLSEYIAPTELNPDLEEPINIFLSYENIGVVRSESFITKVLVDDVLLGQEISIPALDPGEDGTVAIAAPYSSLTGGTKIIRGFVDPDNLIVESDETNNEASRAIIVGDAPNLTFQALNFDVDCPLPGEEVIINANLINEGDLGIEADIQFYYLTDTDAIPIGKKSITASANEIVSTNINWIVVNSSYKIYAEIENTSIAEYDILDNSITSKFCTSAQFVINSSVQGQGIIKKDPIQFKYESDTEISVQAIPAQGWFFKNWLGDLAGNSNPASVLVDSNKNFTAVFELIPEANFALNIDIQGEGTVLKSPDNHTYSNGDIVGLTANPAEGWTFLEWRGDLTGNNSTPSITMDSNASIVAVFVKNLEVSATVQNETCNSASDGSIILNVQGGTLPYNYDWDNDGTGTNDPESDPKDLKNMSSGFYSVIVTDANNFTKPLTVEILLVDSEAPTIVTQENIVLPLNSNGEAILTFDMVDGGSNDNCAISSRELDQTIFTCIDLGENTINYTVYDSNGQTTSKEVQITVTLGDYSLYTWYPDRDNDLYGTEEGARQECEPVQEDSGYTDRAGDCDDNNSNIYPDENGVCEENPCANDDSPSIGDFIVPQEPIEIGNLLNISATYTDDNLANVTWIWGDGYSSKGTFTSNSISGNHIYSIPGVYTVTCIIEDICNNFISEEYQYIVAYDPSGGFVTGAGFFFSQAGAYRLNPLAEGEARFGFVSKYKKGARVPEGRTQFEFISEDYSFVSLDYEWLIVAGEKAMFKGSGEINGLSGYLFMISAIDDNEGGDRFRIRIWEEENNIENVIYDSQIQGGNDTEADPVTYLTKGSIKIHSGKGKTLTEASSETNFSESYTLGVFPNPLQPEGVWLQFSSLEIDEPFNVSVYDLYGRLLDQTTLSVSKDGGRYFWPLDHSGWEQGIYILRAKSETQEFQIKLVK